jgi:heme/copper-type cytochrome/quinol oxidase subunit 2
MSRNQRLGLVAATIAVAVVAFVIAKPGGDDEKQTAGNGGGTATKTTGGGSQDRGGGQQGSKPKATRITIKGGKLQGEPKSISVTKGDPVRIVVSSDAPNKLHLHGFDIEKTAMPGKPARFSFKANIEGEFELESHTFEDAGQEPLVARLLVEPS